jgi:hypothetical protein
VPALVMVAALTAKTASAPHCGDCDLSGDQQNWFALATGLNLVGWAIGALLAAWIRILSGHIED